MTSTTFFITFISISILHFSVLILLTLGVLISLPIIYNNPNKAFYYLGEISGVFMEYYSYLLDETFHDLGNKFFSTNIIIGLSMIIVSLLSRPKNKSLTEVFTFIMHNKKLSLIFGLTVLLLILFINIFLSLLGIGITVNTSSFALFIYTFFAKVISIKLILIFIFSSITKKLNLENLSLSLSNVIFILITGTIHYYYVLPYVYFIIPFLLTKMDNIVTGISFFMESSGVKGVDTRGLVQGIGNLLTKFPLIGKYLPSIKHTNYMHNAPNQFKRSYGEVFTNKIKVYPLNKISKFTTINIATCVRNNLELYYSYGGSISNLESLLNNSIYLKGIISNFFSKYINSTCNIHLVCSDETISINTTVKNGHIEEFNMNRILHFSTKVDKYDVSEQLFSYTKPSDNGYNLQVFMNNYPTNYNYPDSIEQGESSTGTTKQSNFSRETEETLYLHSGDTDIRNINEYSCVDVQMQLVENEYKLVLNFDVKKLLANSSEDYRYLDEIISTSKKVFYNYYRTDEYNANIKFIDDYTFQDIFYSDKMDGFGSLALFSAFCGKFKIPEDKNALNLQPFSSVYWGDTLDFSDKNLDFFNENVGFFNESLDFYKDLDFTNKDLDFTNKDLDFTDEDLGFTNEDLDFINEDLDFSNENVNLFNEDLDFSNENLDILDHSTMDSSAVHIPEVEQNVSPLELTEIYDLIVKLLKRKENGRGLTDNKSSLYNIGFNFDHGKIRDRWEQEPYNITTSMLTRLNIQKPDWFVHKDSVDFSVSIHYLCSNLKDLALENSIYDFTEDNYVNFSEELKYRYQRLVTDRVNKKSAITRSWFQDIEIQMIWGIAVEKKWEINRFTLFLSKLFAETPEIFGSSSKRLFIKPLSIIKLYSNVTNLFPKDFTKEDITTIIEGLEIRKADYLKKNSNIEDCALKSIGIIIKNGMVVETSRHVDYRFTRSLEKLNKHNFPYFKDEKMDHWFVPKLMDALKTYDL